MEVDSLMNMVRAAAVHSGFALILCFNPTGWWSKRDARIQTTYSRLATHRRRRFARRTRIGFPMVSYRVLARPSGGGDDYIRTAQRQ